MKMKRFCVLTVLLLSFFVINPPFAGAQQAVVTYAGNAGKERFNAVAELSDGTILVVGVADNLDWISGGVPKTQIAATGINNSSGTNKIGFLIQFSGNLQTILRVVHFPANAVEEINFIKTTNAPGAATGQIYISGKTNDTRANGGGYFIAKLNNNFVASAPTAISWAKNIWATGDHQTFQPWDVGADGKVVYATGQPFGADWAAVQRLKADGTDDVVENWRYHFGTLTATGANTEGGWTPASSRTDVTVRQSAIVFKAGSRCDLRSWTSEDYSAVINDGNGYTKQGKYPLDAFYNAPCNPANPSSTTSGPGYTGYRIGANPTQRIGSITVDRRNNHFYIGFAIQSRLPDGNPDFEPAVIGMTDSGAMKWWSRLYRETNDNSTPDQYVDGLAIDYSKPATTTELTVLARSHGNNVINLWSGNSIPTAQNPNNPGSSFHNTFTGTNGNIHISWLGKLRVSDGVLMYASYNAEYVDGATNFGAPYPEAIHDGWANHNAGWADLNTTRCKTDVKLDLSGRVYLTCVGRRTITTSNAYQKMLKYGQGNSVWNSYVRVYEPNLKTLAYSSILTGTWNASTGAGGDNTDLLGLFPTTNGVFAVGYHKSDAATGAATGNPIPTIGVPAWGASIPTSESAILARFNFANSAPNNRNKPFDFDGDGKTDVSIFRPAPGEWWIQRSSNLQTFAFQFGLQTDQIAPADYTGDGKTDVAFWRPSNGFWYVLRSEDSTFYSVPFGTNGDVPAPADYDADGKTDTAIFRPSGATWYISKSSGGTIIQQFGLSSDIPAVADYDGDGRSDIAIYRPSNSQWWIQKSSNGSVSAATFGTSSDKPVQGDYTGDGKADIAFWRPGSGQWFILRSEDSSFFSFPFGTSGDLPAPGDYDGDGKFDAAVFRPSGSTWYVNKSTGGVMIQQFGTNGDKPLPGSLIP